MTSDDPHGLRGKVAVVTGGGSGIGRASAMALAQAGARTVIADLSGENAQAVAREIEEAGGTALGIACDVSNMQDIEHAASATLKAFGPCDVLVNNAAMISAGSLESLSLTDWNRLLSVNLTGYFLCAQIFARHMRQTGSGAIVHMASIAGHHATPNAGAYSVAKAGVQMLSQQLAIEWGPSGIRSNCINPGLILTPFSQAMYDRPGITEKRTAMVPARRIGRPEDIADAVLFLASDRARYINGDEITIDGGLTRNILGLMPRAGYD